MFRYVFHLQGELSLKTKCYVQIYTKIEVAVDCHWKEAGTQVLWIRQRTSEINMEAGTLRLQVQICGFHEVVHFAST